MTEIVEFATLDESTQQLIRTSLVARENAYCPYSNFKVGCSLLCTDGTVITGCNVENTLRAATICAERTTISSAVAAGKRSFKTIVVSADLGEGETFLPPCGICRQFLCEFGTDIVVYLVKPSLETVMVTTSGYLLPMSSNLSRLRDIHKK